MNTKMTSRLNINLKKKKKKYFASVALAALILIIIIFRTFSFRIINRPISYILKPFFELNLSLRERWENFRTNFSNKKSLQAENNMFREQISQLNARIALSEVSEKENVVLKNAFSAEEIKKFILASIIFRPPLTSYDMLIIDSGSRNGVQAAMPVLAFGNVLLGYAADVFDDTSKVKLISSFGEETNVFLESSGIPAIAIGRGGENFEIILPRQIKVNVGEKILTFGKQPFLIGLVEKIDHQTTDPYQKIFFRLAVNIQYLNQVFLLKK